MEATSSPKKKPLGLSKEKHDELQQLIKQVTMSTQQRAAKATMPMTPDDSDGEQPTNHTPSDINSSDIQAITSTSGSENQATTSSSDNVTGELNYTSESDRNAPLSTINKSDIDLSDILGHQHVQLHVDISEIEAILAMENDLKPEDISMDQEEDDGHISDATTLPYEFDQEIQDAISIGTSLTCPENKTVIIDEYGISVEVCEAGILHIKTNPTVPKCTGNNDCKIQLHQAEGLLCKAHNVPLSKYRESIEFALMQRITRNKDGAYRECVFCPGRYQRGYQILTHVRGHGGELGRNLKFPISVRMALDDITVTNDRSDNICDDCYEEHKTPHGLQLHRVLEHNDYSDDPLVCPMCRQSLFDESLDLHWSQYHEETCCGVIHNTFGDQVKHYMHNHPRKLDLIFCKSDLAQLYRMTKDNERIVDLPWGRATRIFSSRMTGALLSMRVNDSPKPRSEEFRQLYKTGPSYNIGRDIITKLTEGWHKPTDLSMADNRSILVWTEILLIKNIGKMLEQYLELGYMQGEVPNKMELKYTEHDDWCNRCEMRVDHPQNMLCVSKRHYASVSHAFLAGQLEENLVNMYAGVLIGADGHWYGTGPVGQYSLLNLSMEAWDPLYPTGLMNGQEVVFRKDGRHYSIPEYKDFFKYVKKVADQLPRSYGKPIILEFFMMRSEDQTEEEMECQVEAYFEALNTLRLKFPFLYTVMGTVVDFRDLVDNTVENYREASLKLELVNNMVALYAIKYQVPFMPTQGIINARRKIFMEQELWSHSIHENREELVDEQAFPLREFHRRFGVTVDLLMESFQKTVTTILQLSQPPAQPNFQLPIIGAKSKNNLRNRIKRMRKKAKKRLLKNQEKTVNLPTLGKILATYPEPAQEADVTMADLQEVLENSQGRPPLGATSGEYMDRRDLPEKG